MSVAASSNRDLPGDTARKDLVGFVGVSLLFVVAEGLIFGRFGELGLLVHGLGLFTLFALIQLRDGPVVYLYQSLVLIPVLRVFNLGLPLFSENSLVVLSILYTFLLMSVVLIMRSQGIGFRAIGLFRSRDAFFVAGLGIASGVVLGLIQFLFSLEQFDVQFTAWNALLLLVSAGLLVGLVEELIFRGLIQRWATDLFHTWTGILVVSVMFGFMHSVWLASLDIIFAGVVSVYLGWVYARTNNMWFLVGTHAMINVSAFLVFPVIIPEYQGILDQIISSLF